MGANKALLPWKGSTLIQHLINCLQEAGCRAVIVVVADPHQSAIRARLGSMTAVTVVANPRSELGMLSSLQVGLTAANIEEGEQVIFTPVDVPLRDAAAAKALVEAPRMERCAVSYDGRPGHPVRIGHAAVEALQAAAPDASPRQVLGRYPAWLVPVDDPGVIANLNTPADLARWQTENG